MRLLPFLNLNRLSGQKRAGVPLVFAAGLWWSVWFYGFGTSGCVKVTGWKDTDVDFRKEKGAFRLFQPGVERVWAHRLKAAGLISEADGTGTDLKPSMVSIIQLGLFLRSGVSVTATGAPLGTQVLYDGAVSADQWVEVEAPRGRIEATAALAIAAHVGSLEEACAVQDPPLFYGQADAGAEAGKQSSLEIDVEPFEPVALVPVGIKLRRDDLPNSTDADWESVQFSLLHPGVRMSLRRPCYGQIPWSGQVSADGKVLALLPTRPDGGVSHRLELKVGDRTADILLERNAEEVSESGVVFTVSLAASGQNGGGVAGLELRDLSGSDQAETDFDGDGVLDGAERVAGSSAVKTLSRGGFDGGSLSLSVAGDEFICQLDQQNTDVSLFIPDYVFNVGTVVVSPDNENSAAKAQRGVRQSRRSRTAVEAAVQAARAAGQDAALLTCSLNLRDGLDAAAEAVIFSTASLPVDAVPEEEAAFELTWDGSPTLSDQCTLVLPARFLSNGSAGFSAASGSFAGSGAGVTATSDGLEVDLLSAGLSAGEKTVQWSVSSVEPSQTLALAQTIVLEQQASDLALAIDQNAAGQTRKAKGCGVGCSAGRVQHLAVSDHVCATSTNETDEAALKCWGKNLLGQGGQSPGDALLSPQPVALSAVSALSAVDGLFVGSAHSCALVRSASLPEAVPVCWGSNAAGELGRGTAGSGDLPGQVSSIFAPGVATVQAALGEAFSCFLSASGQVACVGEGGEGQLGDGQGQSSVAPVLLPVSSFDSASVVALAAGRAHVCALARAPGAPGADQVFCWGDNAFGQLGVSSVRVSQADAPEKIASADLGLLAATATEAAETFVFLAAGDGHTCLLTSRQRVLCFGDNGAGQLGRGAAGGGGSVPAAVSFPDNLSSGPVAVAAGSEHTCVLFENRDLACFGRGAEGQLGSGTNNRPAPTRVSFSEGFGVVAFGTGRNTTCVVIRPAGDDAQAGQVACFGAGEFGQMGNGAADAVNASPQVIETAQLALDLPKQCTRYAARFRAE